MMYSKRYSEIKKHLELEERLRKLGSIKNAFERMERGKEFSQEDLKVVQNELERMYGKNPVFGINMGHAIYKLEREVNDVNQKVQVSKTNLKRKGINLEREKRQRRLLHANMSEMKEEMEIER